MGHQGVRDGGPARDPGFRPEDVVGLPLRRALIDLAHEGYDAVLTDPDENTAMLWLGSRVRLVVEDGVVTEVRVG